MKPLYRPLAAVFVTAVVLTLLLILGLAPTAARAQQSAKRAIAVSQGAPDTVVLGDLPQLTEREAMRAPAIARPLRGVSVQQYAALKAQAASVKLPAPSGAAVVPFTVTPEPKPSTGPAATSITSFGGLGIGCGHEFPPDMALAVGPSFVLQAINGCLTVLDKSGNVQAGFPKSLSAFMGVGASAQAPPFDPRALFDWANQRYIVSAAHVNAAGGQIVDVAVSQSSDPRGGWFVYRINLTAAPAIIPSPQIADFPTLGQDRRMIYVAFNAFTLPDTFNGAYMMLLSKSAMYAGASFNFFALTPTFFTVNGTELMDSLQPANVMDRTDNPRAEFVVASHNIEAPGGPSNTECATGCNGLVVFAISNPAFTFTPPGPEVSQFLLPTANNYSLPPLATQSGCSLPGCLIDTGDTRVSGEAVYASGSLYAAIATNGTGAGAAASHFLWFQMRPVLNDNNDTACPGGFQCPDITGASMLNEVCWACATGQGDGTGATFYPEVQPDPEGNVLVVFNYSANDTFPSSAYATNRATQALNTMHDSGFFLQNGLATYELIDHGSGLNRWGDYTAASLDLTPGTQASFWFSGESSKTPSAYRTAIGHNEFRRPGQP